MTEARQALDYGKVAVLMGGWSAERAVSLNSGNAVLAALQSLGVNAVGVDVDRQVLGTLQDGGFDRAFIALHGRGGEDGVIQGALELVGLPYTGSGVLASALAMDKLRTKQVLAGEGLPTPAYLRLGPETDFARAERRLGLPLMVKPAREGSSIGISKVKQPGALEQAWRQAAAFDDVVIAERWISGAEYTVALLGERALPLIRLETPHEFYDYEAKYQADSTRYHCPCGLPADREAAFQRLALSAFEAIGGQGWGRVDLMVDDQGNPWVIEINTVPGLTDHSLVPMAARAAGIEFPELVRRILDTSFSRTPAEHGGSHGA